MNLSWNHWGLLPFRKKTEVVLGLMQHTRALNATTRKQTLCTALDINKIEHHAYELTNNAFAAESVRFCNILTW